LSHDEVKRAVGLFYGFVSAIASAPCSFLYLNNEYLIIKNKKIKIKIKKSLLSLSLMPLRKVIAKRESLSFGIFQESFSTL